MVCKSARQHIHGRSKLRTFVAELQAGHNKQLHGFVHDNIGGVLQSAPIQLIVSAIHGCISHADHA